MRIFKQRTDEPRSDLAAMTLVIVQALPATVTLQEGLNWVITSTADFVLGSRHQLRIYAC